MKMKEFAELTVPELIKRRKELRDESLHLRLQQKAGQIENTSRLRAIRRDVARIETVLSQKRLAKAAATA